MSDSNQVERDERRRLLLSQQIDAAFGDHFDILTKLERKPKKITANDRAKYEAAKKAVENLAIIRIEGLEERTTQALMGLRAALNGATEFMNSGSAVEEGEKQKKAGRPSNDEIRERGRVEREVADVTQEEAAEEPLARESEREYEVNQSLGDYAETCHRRLGALERRIKNFLRWVDVETRERSLQEAGEIQRVHADIQAGIFEALGNLGVKVAADVPEEFADVVNRLNQLGSRIDKVEKAAAEYDQRAEARHAELAAKTQEQEPIVQEFVGLCGEIRQNVEQVLSLPLGTPAERYEARARLEMFVQHFAAYTAYWKLKAAPYLQAGDGSLAIWQEAIEANNAVHNLYQKIKDRRTEFQGVAAQEWEINRTRIDVKIAVLRARLIEVLRKEGDERETEAKVLELSHADVEEEWAALKKQLPREFKAAPDSPVIAIDVEMRRILRDIQALLAKKDVRVLEAQEAYSEKMDVAVHALGCWNHKKSLRRRVGFLRAYLDNEIEDGSRDFSEFVTDSEAFRVIIGPLVSAKNEIDIQESEDRREELRAELRHPWLSGLRADQRTRMSAILEDRLWKKEASTDERRRLLEVGGDLPDEDAAIVAGVRNVRVFRKAIASLNAGRAGIIAFQDQLLDSEDEPAVEISLAQLQQLASRFADANTAEWEAREALVKREGWKIAGERERGHAIGEYLRFPNKDTAEKFTDDAASFREPLNAWRAAVHQKLDRRDALRWALQKNQNLIPQIGRVTAATQRIIDSLAAQENAPAPEQAAPRVRTPELLDARGEAIRDRRRDIGDLLAHDMFWDPSVSRPVRFSRINAMLKQQRADARLKSDLGLRNVAEFYDAAAFTDFADLEVRIQRLRGVLIATAPTVDAAVTAATSAPAAASAPVPSAVRSTPPAPAPTPAVIAGSPAPAPSASRLAPTPPSPSRPPSITAPAVAAAATGAAGILGRLTARVEASRAEGAASTAAGSVPPPLPAPERVAAATAGSPEPDRAAALVPSPAPEPTAPRTAPASVRAALPPTPGLVRSGESAPVIGSPARTAEAAAAARPEPLVTGAPAPIDAARREPAIGGGAESDSRASRLAPSARPPMRRELPAPPELTNEVRVSSWAKSIRSTVGRWFGRDLGDYVASELTGEQMERERQNQIMSRPEVVVRTASSFMGIAGRLLGFQALVDVPRYFTQSFIKENERALLRAEILEAMEHEAQGRATGREGDRQRASIEASTRLERAINTSAHLTSEQKAEMITRVNVMRTTYQERSFAVAEARSKELAELVEANVQAKVNGWRAAKETVNSALAVLSFGGAPLIAGVGYGAARGVSYLAMSLQEKYVAAAVQNPRSSWVGRVQATFRDTWASTWNRLSTPTETVGQRLMNAVDALAEIGNAVGVPTAPAISGLERSLPALRSLEGSTDSGIAQIVANAQQAIQNTIDRILPVFERLTARQASNPVTT